MKKKEREACMSSAVRDAFTLTAGANRQPSNSFYLMNKEPNYSPHQAVLDS